MFDFGALPPEVNSGRMYIGAGSGPLLAAAAAWDELAGELMSTASSYGSTIQGLTAGPWAGPSSLALAAAAAPYVSWMSATGTQAEHAATQAKLAAGAYEAAFAATVPPPVVAANRSLLATLIATNILGQNTPAIATTEAHYAEMWAQDAAAMYAYAGSSAAAAQFTPFNAAPKTTNDSGAAMQSDAVAQSNTVSGMNSALKVSQLSATMQPLAQTTALSSTTGSTGITAPATPQILTNWNTIWSAITGVYSPQSWSSIPGGPFLSFGQAYAWGQNGQGAAAYLAGPKAISGALAPLTSGAGGVHPMLSSATAPASASMGKAPLVGSMSVPQGWTQAAPEIKTLAQVLPANLAAAPEAALAGEDGVMSQMALSSLAGRAVAATAVRSGGGVAGAGSLGGLVAEANPAAATIIVIPALEA
ncbi:PPE family protein [Mycobacterium rhizamassiliense]|jgi:PPE-repeat protein|uniref:PPE family protein n=1 Tax=Mycobacterium rhizamassiliense TaxID=1841860 RepID=A0A2U3NZ11_9MYCO|nr:PPE family protein [Mycobacterium rhizamassiliense]SPM36726.1 PPE family protein [Mycobacterium rhizamassiliense]